MKERRRGKRRVRTKTNCALSKSKAAGDFNLAEPSNAHQAVVVAKVYRITFLIGGLELPPQGSP